MTKDIQIQIDETTLDVHLNKESQHSRNNTNHLAVIPTTNHPENRFSPMIQNNNQRNTTMDIGEFQRQGFMSREGMVEDQASG